MTPAITVVAAIIRGVDGRICLSKRPDHKHQGGRWEFPGGKVEAGESKARALARELDEELGMTQASSTPFMSIAHQYPDIHVTLHFREVRQWQGEPQGQEGQEVAWFTLSQLADLSFPAANQPVVTALQLPEQLLILPPSFSLKSTLKDIEQLDGAVQGLYLRTLLDSVDKHTALLAIAERCHQQGVRFWVKDNAELALSLNAYGLHLSSPSLMASQQRPLFPGIVSAACHSAAQLDHAETLGLNMALVSPVKATPSHADAQPLGWQGLAERVQGRALACYALGGMSPDDLDQARTAGAIGVAGIGQFWPNLKAK